MTTRQARFCSLGELLMYIFTIYLHTTCDVDTVDIVDILAANPTFKSGTQQAKTNY